jgi:secreted PhoX family phosphatase
VPAARGRSCGTVLSCEENLHNYFLGDAAKGLEAQAYRRYGITGRGRYIWGRFHDRFRLDKEPLRLGGRDRPL